MLHLQPRRLRAIGHLAERAAGTACVDLVQERVCDHHDDRQLPRYDLSSFVAEHLQRAEPDGLRAMLSTSRSGRHRQPWFALPSHVFLIAPEISEIGRLEMLKGQDVRQVGLVSQHPL